MARKWTAWTASLAWGEALTETQRAANPDRWLEVEHLADAGRRACTLIGLSVQAVGQHYGKIPEAIVSPRDLGAISLPRVILMLAQGTVKTLLGPLTMRNWVIGPSETDPLGLVDLNALKALYSNDILGWDTLSTLAHSICMWHFSEEEFRSDTTLGDRLPVIEQHARRQQRDELLGATRFLHDDSEY